MIKTELIMVDERQLRRTWSDTGFMIERDGAMYSEAVDPAEFDRVYTETDIQVDDSGAITATEVQHPKGGTNL